jgi:hypothetical protein
LVSVFIALMILLAPSLAAAAGPPDPRFGAVETYDAPAAATEMGAGWTRVPFLWAQMQPSGSHEWLPPVSDEALALEIAQGRQPVGLIITTPAWATDTSVGPGVPNGLHSGHNDPNNLWASFVRQLVSTYAGRIDHWIVWNEPDVWDPAHPGYTWGGSVEDFLQLQRVAYATIKETNPGATVIFSGTSYWWDAAHGRDLYFRRYLDALVQDGNAAGNNHYCDAIALHVYFQPDFVYSITALYHQLMREHGFDKPVWIVETNAAPSLDPQMPAPNSRFAITLEEQAAYVIQALAMGIAGGASRIAVFKMIDTPGDLAANPEPFGLLRADGSRRPAFSAYRVAATYLAGFQGGQLEQRPEVSIVTVPRASGTTTVLWTRTPAPATVQVSARAATATLVDIWGRRRAISASDGVYTVELPGARCTHTAPCIIGGAPYLIVEGSVDAAPPPPSGGPGFGDSGFVDSGAELPNPELPNPESPISQPPTPTLRPEYLANLPIEEVKSARNTWNKHALPGYQIQLVAGPPFHLYLLTVVGQVVTEARRSQRSLAVDPDDLPDAFDAVKMTTLYNGRAVAPYTVEDLFNRTLSYYKKRPGCDTQVVVQLDREWDFPRRVVERPAGECPSDEEPSWLAVVAFATLTPTPTLRVEPQDEAATPTASPTPSPTATATATVHPTPTTTPSPSPTPPSPATVSNVSPAWVVLLASAVILGVFLIRRNGKNVKRKT